MGGRSFRVDRATEADDGSVVATMQLTLLPGLSR